MRLAVNGLDEISKWANKQVRIIDQATLKAINYTAYDLRFALNRQTFKDFDKPTKYTASGFYVRPARSQNDYAAEVGVINNRTRGVPQVRYMAPEVYGGERSMKSTEKKLGSYLGPSRFAPRDQYGNVPGSFYKRVLSQLQLSSDPMQNATNSKRSKKKRETESFFFAGNVLLSRKGEVERPMLFLLDKSPRYKPRFSFYETTKQFWTAEFGKKLEREYQKAKSR